MMFFDEPPLTKNSIKIPFIDFWMVFEWYLNDPSGIMAKGIWMVSEWFFEWYFGFFVPFSGIEWYFKLPLRVPMSPTEISLILNGIQW